MKPTLHSSIADEWRKQNPQSHHTSDTEILSAIFSNYRIYEGKETGLRLSTTGRKFMDKLFDSYKYDNNEYVTPRILVGLDRHMKWPYYITNSAIIFYSEEDAALYNLYNRDLKALI